MSDMKHNGFVLCEWVTKKTLDFRNIKTLISLLVRSEGSRVQEYVLNASNLLNNYHRNGIAVTTSHRDKIQLYLECITGHVPHFLFTLVNSKGICLSTWKFKCKFLLYTV